MVLVGSSFGSSGILWCFVRVWLSVILYSAAGCYPCVRDASLATPFEGLSLGLLPYDPGLPQTPRRRFFAFGGGG